jgi:hypothetical protein
MKPYPPQPENVERYQSDKGYGYTEPTSVGSWEWSGTFGKWGRHVTFDNGWSGFTWPEPEWIRDKRHQGDNQP